MPEAHEAHQLDSAATSFRLLVYSNTNVQNLQPHLLPHMHHPDLNIETSFAPCSQIKYAAESEQNLALLQKTDAILVWFWLPAYSPVLTSEFAHHPPSKISWDFQRTTFTCSSMIQDIRKHTAAPILWLGFEPIPYPSYGIADANIGQRGMIAQLNMHIAKTLHETQNAHFIDAAILLERVGITNFYTDNQTAKDAPPFTEKALQEAGHHIKKYIRALAGKQRKCLVLDCDNTLWGGIVGEDGLNGIRMNPEDGGIAYHQFQQQVLNLFHRGIILAICSKNNEEDVTEVLHKRKDMLLKEEHLAVIKANWEDKAANIRAIARQLNIGTDALVFIDDSPQEIAHINSVLPEVATIQVDAQAADGHAGQLMQCSFFEALVITDEDKRRTEMYRAEAKRNAYKDALTEIEEHFGAHFEIKSRYFVPQGEELDRAAQLCQRTNQFNLTTRRYTRTDLESMLATGQHQITALQVEDKFGDCGMVGLAIVKCDAEEAEILQFLMSCRALSRGIEAEFLKEIIAKLPGKRIIGTYIPTQKNRQTETFYPKNGFTPLREENGTQLFTLDPS